MDDVDRINDRNARESGLENGNLEIPCPDPVRNVETRIGCIKITGGWHELKVREPDGKAVAR